MKQQELPLVGATQSPGWLIAEPLDSALQQQIADFNRRGLRWVLTLLTGVPEGRSVSGVPRAVLDLRALWRALDSPAIARLAAMPYLLFDLGMGSPGLLTSAHTPARLPASAIGDERQDFATLVLHYAWHLARANPLGAAVALGLPGPSAAALRELPFADLHRIVPGATERLTLRWAGRPAVWRPLLTAVAGDDADALQREQLIGLRRLAGDLLAAASAPGAAAARVSDALW